MEVLLIMFGMLLLGAVVALGNLWDKKRRMEKAAGELFPQFQTEVVGECLLLGFPLLYSIYVKDDSAKTFCRVSDIAGGNKSPGSSTFFFPCSPQQGVLLCRKSVATKIFRTFKGMQDLSLGIPEFDEHFCVRAPSLSARSILEKEDVRNCLSELCQYKAFRELAFISSSESVAQIPWRTIVNAGNNSATVEPGLYLTQVGSLSTSLQQVESVRTATSHLKNIAESLSK